MGMEITERQEEADNLRQLAYRARQLASVLAEPEKSRVMGCAKELETEASQLVRTRRSILHQ